MKSMSYEAPGPYVTIYKFEALGEKIPMHKHPFSHSTTVISGSVACRNGEKSVTLVEGQTITFRPDIDHEIEALDASTIIANIADAKPH